MLYEKKMLILSGDGKGVVLIEKSAQGVKFSLRTFDMPRCDDLKAGIVTRTSVFVRDLPSGNNPAAVFSVNAGNIDELHFAVFDKHLRLYGTNGKRMWEANLMDLLNKNDRRAPVLTSTPAAALPPIAPRPQVLPMPDGTGIPQSRLAIYGDEAIAESDFYTPIDFQSRMSEVDGFLDTPRVLDGLAPRVVPPPNIPARNLVAAETTAALDGSRADSTSNMQAEQADSPSVEVDFSAADAPTDDRRETAETTVPDSDLTEELGELAEDVEPFGAIANAQTDDNTQHSQSQPQPSPVGEVDTDATQYVVKTAPTDAPAQTEQHTRTDRHEQQAQPIQTVKQTQSVKSDNFVATSQPAVTATPVAPTQFEAAATVAARAEESYDGDMPWALAARWLKNRTKRMPLVRKENVRKTPVNDSVRFLRKSDFFERARADIDKLFANAEKDKELGDLLTDMEWVKVAFDGHKISVGRAGNAFLCYAVGGVYEKVSPLGDEAQWLPSQRETPTGNGYWLIFQNLADGRIIKN